MTARYSDSEPTPVQKAVAEFNDEIKDFKERHMTVVDDVKSRLEKLEVKADIPTYSGSGKSQGYDVKAFEQFLRTGDRGHLERQLASGPRAGRTRSNGRRKQ